MTASRACACPSELEGIIAPAVSALRDLRRDTDVDNSALPKSSHGIDGAAPEECEETHHGERKVTTSVEG